MKHRCRDNRLQQATSMILIGMLLVLSSAVTALAQVAVDPALQPYEKVSTPSPSRLRANLYACRCQRWVSWCLRCAVLHTAA